jgi:hypothetical protein
MNPPPGAPTEASDSIELLLPLRVIAPAFLKHSKSADARNPLPSRTKSRTLCGRKHAAGLHRLPRTPNRAPAPCQSPSRKRLLRLLKALHLTRRAAAAPLTSPRNPGRAICSSDCDEKRTRPRARSTGGIRTCDC